MSKSEVARTLCVSRRTVYHWIETGQLDRAVDEEPARYRARPPVARKVDPNLEVVKARLAQYPKLTAPRLFAEIQADGYAGGYTQVKEYVRQMRPAAP